MELNARQSSNKILAMLFVGLLLLLVLSLATSLWLAIDNRALRSTRSTIVTPMGYDAPFAIAEQRASPAYLQMMALSLLALRLNVSPETVDAQHQFLLGFVRPGAQPDFKVTLAGEAKRIKQNEVNSAFYHSQVNVVPGSRVVDIRGLLKTWIGNGKPSAELKHYRLSLNYADGVTSIERFLEVDDDAR